MYAGPAQVKKQKQSLIRVLVRTVDATQLLFSLWNV